MHLIYFNNYPIRRRRAPYWMIQIQHGTCCESKTGKNDYPWWCCGIASSSRLPCWHWTRGECLANIGYRPWWGCIANYSKLTRRPCSQSAGNRSTWTLFLVTPYTSQRKTFSMKAKTGLDRHWQALHQASNTASNVPKNLNSIGCIATDTATLLLSMCCIMEWNGWRQNYYRSSCAVHVKDGMVTWAWGYEGLAFSNWGGLYESVSPKLEVLV